MRVPSNHGRTTANNNTPKDAVEVVESTLAQLGPFGLYQLYVLLLLAIPNMLSAMYTFNYVFTADEVPFRCVIEECEGFTTDFSNATASALLPSDSCQRHPFLGENPLSMNICDPSQYNMTYTEQCDRFVYDNIDTIFAEFDLACRAWLRTLVGSVRNAALPLALLLTGFVSDRWGRLTALCIFSAFAGVLGVIKSVSVSYSMYVSMEFLEAALGYGFNSAAYVMIIELARPSLRGTFACLTGVWYGAGGVLLSLAASRVPYWRSLLRVLHVPALLLPLYWRLLDESVRWQHARGRREKAVATVRKVARWNKVTLDEDLIKEFLNEEKNEESKPPNPWLSLLKSKVLIGRFLLCGWCWIAAAFVYYGLTINSVSLHGDKYVNFALNMAMEIVASLLLMMALERFGRKWTIFNAFLLCGLSSVIQFFVSHQGALGLVLYFAGKLSVTCAFNSLYVWTAELFPTATRSSALAACSLVGRVGSILAPQTPLLSANLQAFLYGGASLLAAGVALAVPETRRTQLPQSASDAEQLHTPPQPDYDQPPAPPSPIVYSADM